MDFLESAVRWRPNSKTLKLDMKFPWEVPLGDETSETLRCLWPFFRYFRIIGMCPLSREGNKVSVRKKWHPSWYSTWFGLTVMFVMWTNFVRRIFPITAVPSVVTSNILIYYTQILFNCVYMIWRANEIPRFVNSCILVEGIFKRYHGKEQRTTGLMRDSYLLLVFFISSQLTGNMLYYGSYGNSKYKKSFGVTHTHLICVNF